MRRALTSMLLAGLLAAPALHAASGNEDAEFLRPIATEGCAWGTSGDVTRTTDQADVDLDETVIVTPRIDVRRTLEPGDTFTCDLTIRSRRSEPATFQLETYGLVGSHAPGASFEFITEDDPRFDSTAGAWLDPLVPEVELDPREVVRVPIRVTVPQDPPTGSAYGSVNVSSRTRADTGDTVLGIETQAATVFLLRIGGEGAPDLQLRDVDAPRLRWDREAWQLTADLDNDGTLHATASGRVRVRSIFGNVVAELPIEQETILPKGREPINVTWKGVPWFGLYRYDVRVENRPVAAGAPAPRSVDVVDGWFLALPPWWVLVLVALVPTALAWRWWRGRAAPDDWPDDEFEDQPGR